MRAVRSALWAVQAGFWRRLRWRQPRECVEMTPPGRRRSPLLTLAGKWSSSSGTINGDRSTRSAGGRWGGGVAGPTGAGASALRSDNTDPQGRTAAQRGHVDTRLTPGNPTMGHRHHKGGTPGTQSYTAPGTVSDTSHNTTGSNKWLSWTHTTGSQTQSYNQFTPRRQGPTLP